MKYYVGLDLGGTYVKAGLIDAQTNVLSQGQFPTQADKGPDTVIEVMADAARQVAGDAGMSIDAVASIGIGSPGPIDFDAGVVKSTPNLANWQDVPLRDRIAEATGRPAVLENDANAAAFGEFWTGAARDQSIQHMIMFTLGTGIGSGVIIDGKIVHGAFNDGGEAGHIIVQPGGRQCDCGQRGCMEAYASASYTARRAAEAVDAGEPSILKADGELNAKMVFEAAAKGDALATRIIDETAEYLAIGCVNFCRILDPQMIVFAGGMILAGDMLFDRIRSAFARLNWKLTEPQVQILPAALGNDAGFIGAAAVACAAD